MTIAELSNSLWIEQRLIGIALRSPRLQICDSIYGNNLNEICAIINRSDAIQRERNLQEISYSAFCKGRLRAELECRRIDRRSKETSIQQHRVKVQELVYVRAAEVDCP